MRNICGSAAIVNIRQLRSVTQNHMWKQSIYRVQVLSVPTAKLFVLQEKPCQPILEGNTNKYVHIMIPLQILINPLRFRRLHSIQNAEDPWRNVAMSVLFTGVESENQHFWAYWSKPCWDPWLQLWCLFQALSHEKCPPSSQTQRA